MKVASDRATSPFAKQGASFAMYRPFEPRIEGDSLHGFGTCDMKGGLSARLCAIIGLKRPGVGFAVDILFAGLRALHKT